MRKNIIFITIIFIISGCGMMGSSSKKDSSLASTSENTIANLDLNSSDSSTQLATRTSNAIPDITPTMAESTDSIVVAKSDILPQTISMDFPEILTDETPKESNESLDSNTSDNNITEENQSNQINDIGYQQVRKNISQIKNIVTIAQINLVLLEKVMPQVLDRCEGMSSCVFEPRFLSIVLDNETISKIDDIIDDKNISWIDRNSSNQLYFGELSFAKYDNNRSYNYELTLDMVSDNINLGYKDENNISDANVTEYQIFKWSDDNKNVTTNYFYEDNKTYINISIFYLVDEDGKETMHVYNTTHDENEGKKENMNLTLADKEDDNSTLILQSNTIEQYIDGNESNISSFSANAEISDKNSLIRISGNISNEETQTSELSCDNNSSCQDSNSTDTNSNLEFYELEITGGNLEDGSYILLPPHTNIDGLELIDIFGLTLGTFTIFDNQAQGEIHNSSYNDIVNRLTIVKIDESQDSENMFEIVPQEDKPTIKIVNY